MNFNAGHQIFFLARQKGMFMKHVIKEDGYKLIDVAILMVVGHEKCVDSQETIRDITSFNESSIARSLKDLEKKGLITRVVNPENKRIKLVNLTEAGTAITKRFDRIMDFWDEQALSDLNDNDRDVLGKVLEKALADRKKLDINNMLQEWRELENE